MALVLANRVQETATPNTTVSFTLTGAVQGFQSFATVGNTNTTYYSATDTLGNWEVGLGTYSSTGPTLTRTTIYASSNSGSAVTFPGSVTVFVTYPSGKSVNLDATGNVSALGTVSSGTWQGSTIGVAYGGTGVTTSSGANSVMLRDANQNTAINRLNQSNTNTTAAGGTTALTAASSYSHTLVGTGNQTFTLPDATTLTTGVAFLFNNQATGTVTIQDYATATIGTITAGGAGAVFLTDNSTVGGTWDVHGYLPEGVTWGTNALNLGSTVISNGTWQGGTIQSGYGGTGLTTFTGANNALYSTSASNLVAGTLPIAAGGTGVTTTPTNGQLLIGNGTNYTVSSLGSGTGISTTTGAGTLTINNTGVTSLAGTSPVTASASTGSVTMSLASGYGDTQNPYASKTANFFLAAPNGSAGAPTFRAIVAADIPTLNQNTTGSAGSVANAVTFNNGGAGDASGTTFNGSAARTISYNTIGAPSTTGTNATGTWAINIIGNAATATSATSAGSTTVVAATANNGIQSAYQTTINTTTPGLGLYGVHFNGQTTADYASGITWNGGTGTTTNANAGIYVQGSGAYGTKMYIATTDSYAVGAKTAISIDSLGVVQTVRSYFQAAVSSRAPLFYDSDNTAYYTDPASTSVLNGVNLQILNNNTWYSYNDNDRNAGSATYLPTAAARSVRFFFATAASTGVGGNYAGVFQFNPWDGTTSSTGDAAYQLAFGGTAANGAGVPQLNIRKGIDSTWNSWYTLLHSGNYNSYAPTLTGTGASGTWGISITGSATQLGGYGSSTYVGKFGNTYYQADTWIQCNGIGGLYWPATNAAELNANTTSSYGAIAILGSRNSWRGIHFQGGGNTPHLMFDGSANGGIYYETGGRWASYYNYSNNCWGIGTSTTNSTYNVYADKGYYAGTRIDSPIFYDANDTGYYVNPNSTSNVYGINASFVNSIVLGRGGGSLSSNIAVGSSALGNNTSGTANVAIGVQSLANNTSGYDQTAVGNLAMFYMQGDSNTATGSMAMYGGTSPASNTGTNNSAFGKEALNTLTSGSLNVAVGARAYFAYDSVNYPTTATGNVAVGPYVAAYSFYAKSGNDNVLIGNQAAYYLNSGQGNVAAGAYAGNNLNSGSDNTFIGYYAGYNSYGSNTGNVYIGRNAGYNTGNYAVYNVAIGAYALDGATTSTGYNVAVGTESLGSNTSAYYNTAVGSYSLAFNTTGGDNVALGAYAGYNNTTGGYNIAIGRNALYSGTTGYSHTVIGTFAGYNMTTGSSLTAVGESAAYNIRGTNNTAVGQAAMIGSFTPANNTGQENSSFGVASLYSITSGSRNTAIGSNNLRSVTSGTDNVALGFGAGYRTSGGTTASATTTGTFNIYIGNYTYPGSATATRELIIGYDIIGKGSNTGFISVGGSIYQGNNTTTWATTSDARIKQNFVPVTNGLEVINGLEPFEFDYILTGKHDVGFKAQQYITVLPEQVTKHAASPDEKEIVGEDEIYGIQRNLDPYFVSAIKALTEQVKALQQEIAQLKGA